MRWMGEGNTKMAISVAHSKREEETGSPDVGIMVTRHLDFRASFHETPEALKHPERVFVWGSRTF